MLNRASLLQLNDARVAQKHATGLAKFWLKLRQNRSIQLNLLKTKAYPSIESNRLIMRKPSMKDAPIYHHILSFPETSRYSDVPHQPTVKRSERFVSWMSKLESRGTGIAWLVCLRDNPDAGETSSVIGSVRINSIEKKAQCGMLGYELHPEYWSNGYATEALGSVVKYAHNEIALNRLEAWTIDGNVASERVLIKNGFQFEGMQREKAMLRGRYRNIRLFGRLANDKLSA